MKSSIIFHSGKFIKTNQKILDQLRPGILEVNGVFETIYVYKGNLIFIEDHWSRLLRGLKLYKIKIPFSIKKIEQICLQIIGKNQISSGRIRVAVYKDINGKTKLSIVGQKVEIRDFSVYQRGYKACTTSVVRSLTKYSHIKSHRWSIFYRALSEARNHGCDEAILLNSKGQLVEGSTSNLFFIKNNVLKTPSIKCGCLNGIARKHVIKLAKQSALKVKIGEFKFKDLLNADEVFITNAILPVMPIVKINGQDISKRKIGDQTAKILKIYQNEILANLNSKKS